jgi:hypothetical protein
MHQPLGPRRNRRLDRPLEQAPSGELAGPVSLPKGALVRPPLPPEADTAAHYAHLAALVERSNEALAARNPALREALDQERAKAHRRRFEELRRFLGGRPPAAGPPPNLRVRGGSGASVKILNADGEVTSQSAMEIGPMKGLAARASSNPPPKPRLPDFIPRVRHACSWARRRSSRRVRRTRAGPRRSDDDPAPALARASAGELLAEALDLAAELDPATRARMVASIDQATLSALFWEACR